MSLHAPATLASGRGVDWFGTAACANHVAETCVALSNIAVKGMIRRQRICIVIDFARGLPRTLPARGSANALA